MTAPAAPASGLDRPTLVCIALVAYALANVAHEGLGHGGACLASGGRAIALSAVYFECDPSAFGPHGDKWESAGGTLVNLLLGGSALLALRLRRRSATSTRYFLWLVMTVNLLQGAGYWLFSGLGNVGDWARVIDGWMPHWAWRMGLALAGGGAYWGTIQLSLRELLPFLGQDGERLRRARTLCLAPYVAGGLLYVAAGLLNPVGWALVLISAAAASFGGTSGLAWMSDLLRDQDRFAPSSDAPLRLARSASWIGAGLLIAAAFVLVLGPTVRF